MTAGSVVLWILIAIHIVACKAKLIDMVSIEVQVDATTTVIPFYLYSDRHPYTQARYFCAIHDVALDSCDVVINYAVSTFVAHSPAHTRHVAAPRSASAESARIDPQQQQGLLSEFSISIGIDVGLRVYDEPDPNTQALEACIFLQLTAEECKIVTTYFAEYFFWNDNLFQRNADEEKESQSCMRYIQVAPPLTAAFPSSVIASITSSADVTPSFQVGSDQPVVRQWLTGEASYFAIFRHFFPSASYEGRLALDLGANRGFYTYYLAALGFEVHAFEIQSRMFKILQHGLLFNDQEVADRVHLYRLGISDKHESMTNRLSDGCGHLAPVQPGEMASVHASTLDCFLDFLQQQKQTEKVVIDFLKMDIEGYEMAAFVGGLQFLEKVEVQSMWVEIGPSRWARSRVSIEGGLQILQHLRYYFRTVLVALTEQPHCPMSLQATLGLSSPGTPHLVIQGVPLFEVSSAAWSVLVAVMEEGEHDCNFWFQQ